MLPLNAHAFLQLHPCVRHCLLASIACTNRLPAVDALFAERKLWKSIERVAHIGILAAHQEVRLLQARKRQWSPWHSELVDWFLCGLLQSRHARARE
eukprot:scaffold66750_cov33-Tisochrysis_lutea.AAC.2